MNQLESLARHTKIVADTGDIDSIERFRPQDATTNPSLLKKAVAGDKYAGLVEEAVAAARQEGRGDDADALLDQLFVRFGRRILEIVPGRVSTEVPARLSFDVDASIEKAERLISLYEAAGVERERVLIKLASTWEGVRAAERLERAGIHCNMTLLFSLAQAAACASAGATLISPFVGRIYDWYRADRGVDDISIEEDPGVESVRSIYAYYKTFDLKVEIMGASFRKADQVVALAGCDLLTISPDLLEELQGREGDVPRRLDPEATRDDSLERLDLDEEAFRWHLNQDAMATEKLAEGIRRFHEDAEDLARLVQRELVND